MKTQPTPVSTASDGNEPTAFEPDWTIHPGTILRQEISERGMTSADLVRATGMNHTSVSMIFAGKRGIGTRFAIALENAGIGTARLWVNLMANYKLDVMRGRKVME